MSDREPELIEHAFAPAMPLGTVCRYCGKAADDTIHPVELHRPLIVEGVQSVPLAILDHTSDRGAMLATLVKIAEEQLRQQISDNGLRARGHIVLTINLQTEAS